MSKAADKELTTRELTTAPLAEPGIAPAMPTRIGKYIVGDRIGTGGMGVVYRAQHSETGAMVAIKVIRAGVASEETVARLDQEAKALGSLRHPGIAAVHDAGAEMIDGIETPYIAMEYLPGAKPITAYAEGMNERQKLELFVSVCRAIEHANSRGIIHRDLKPSNILVDADGAVKVIDFGVAKVLHASGERAQMTEVGRLVGTPEYMSPEQVQGRSELIDARTDVYGLGVVLYELLCGRLPYEVARHSPLEAMRVICDDPPTLPTQVRRGFSDELQTILLKMLAKERPRRYQSAGEAADDVERYLHGRPVQARRDTVSYRFRKALTRAKEHNRVSTAAAILLGGIILALSLGDAAAYRWTGAARSMVGWLTSFSAPPVGDEPEHVVVIGVREPEALSALVAAAGGGPVDPADPTSWRAAYGLLMERLSECQPSSVGFDFRFRSCNQSEGMVRGLEMLRNNGIGTVLGTTGFVRLGERPDEICRALVEAATASGSVAVSGAGQADYAVRLGLIKAETRARCASFGTAMFALTRRPDAPAFDLDITQEGLHINYSEPVGDKDLHLAPRHDRLRLTEWGAQEPDPTRNIGKGDVLASAAVVLPAWAYEEAGPHTQLLSDVLNEDAWSDERLARWVRNKAVVVIDLRPGEDSAVDKDGRTFHKGYLWAAWLEQALREAFDADTNGRWAQASTIRAAKNQVMFIEVVLGALVGSLMLFVPSRRRWLWSIGALVVGTAGFLGVSVVAMSQGVMIIPILGIFALWVTCGACILFPRPMQA